MMPTMTPQHRLSDLWAGPVLWVALAEIMAQKTCEERDLSEENDREILRGDYFPGAYTGYESWPEFLADIRRNGLAYPVMWDATSRTLGNGHHRVVAAWDLGWTHIPVIGWDSENDWDVQASDSWYPSGGE